MFASIYCDIQNIIAKIGVNILPWLCLDRASKCQVNIVVSLDHTVIG